MKYKYEASERGVSWDSNSGYSFNIKTGEVLKLKDIITDGKFEFIITYDKLKDCINLEKIL